MDKANEQVNKLDSVVFGRQYGRPSSLILVYTQSTQVTTSFVANDAATETTAIPTSLKPMYSVPDTCSIAQDERKEHGNAANRKRMGNQPPSHYFKD